LLCSKVAGAGAQQRDLVVHILDGMSELEALAARLRHLSARRRLRNDHRRSRRINRPPA
jgi:hypothetical protein